MPSCAMPASSQSHTAGKRSPCGATPSLALLPLQSAARRPSAERLLALPAVRAKAAELGIELPPIQLPAAPTAAAGSPGAPQPLGERRRVTAAHPGSRNAAAPAAPLARPPRRASCPDGGPDGAWEQRPPARRVTVQERRKPPLPPAAVPQRRRTVQAGAAVQQAPSLPKAPAGGAAPVEHLAGSLDAPSAPVEHLAGSLDAPSAPQAPVAAALTSAPAPAQLARSPSARGASPAPPPLRETRFSVQQHLGGMSAAARQWLQQRSASRGGGGGDALVELEVQRSVKSDSSLLARPADRAAAEVAAGPRCGGAAAAETAAEPEAESAEAACASPAGQLRKRCVALLGSEALYAELHAMTKAAVEVEQGGGGSGGSGGNGCGSGGVVPTMASLGDAIFARTGSSGRAAEALFLLMQVLAAEG